jgi:hypothetical protein
MKSLSSLEEKYGFGRLTDATRHAAAVIEKRRRMVAAVLPKKVYERVKVIGSKKEAA